LPGIILVIPMGDAGRGGEPHWGLPLGGVIFLTALVAAVLLAGCGGSSSGGTPTLNWFVATQPGGTIQEVAKRCTDEAHGKYKINVELLPSDASQQREQLVRRLAAKDSSVDLIGMDVIWTAEFANAGWIREWPASLRKQVTAKVFPSVIKTAPAHASPA